MMRHLRLGPLFAAAVLVIGQTPDARAQTAAPHTSVALAEEGRRPLKDSTDIGVLVTNHTDQILVVTTAALDLESGAPCTVTAVHGDFAEILPGSAGPLRFELACSGFLRSLAGASEATLTLEILYQRPVGLTRVTPPALLHVRWLHSKWIVALGAGLGATIAYVLLVLYRLTGRRARPVRSVRPFVEWMFGLVVAGVLVFLVRAGVPDLPGPLSVLVADTFGHGFVLGLCYDALGHILVGFMTGGPAPDEPPPEALLQPEHRKDGPPVAAGGPR